MTFTMKKYLIAFVLIGILVFGLGGIPRAKADTLTDILNQVSLTEQDISTLKGQLSGMVLNGALSATQTNEAQQTLNMLASMPSSPAVSHEATGQTSVTATTPQPSSITFLGPLVYGQTSNQVTELQNWLIENDFLAAGDNTGYYGKATAAAVLAFQKANGINGDGTVVGPKTEEAIVAAGNHAPEKVGIPVITRTPVAGGTLTPRPITFCPLSIAALPTPATQIVSVGTTGFTFANIEFSAPTNCDITLNQITVVATSPVSGVIANLKIYDGTAQEGSTVASPSTANAIGPGLGISIPAGTSVTLSLEADVIGIGSGAKALGISSVSGTGVFTGTTTQLTVTSDSTYWGQGMKIAPGVCVPTYTYIMQWGTAGTGNGQFGNPYGMAINPAGNIIYISDYINNRIQEFTLSGQYITQFGGYGAGNGQFYLPEGIAFGPNGNLYVVDYGNNRIEEFTSNGQYITQWGMSGSGNGQFALPYGIAIDSSGNVYVTDSDNHRIQKFNSNGTYITQWGSLGSGNGQFILPLGVALDPSGNVYVADGAPNSRVEEFTSNGIYLNQFGGNGTGNGQFTIPSGILITTTSIYATDNWGANIDRVQVFTHAGQYFSQFGSYGTGNGQFNGPDNIIMNAMGDLYVMDSYNDRIQEFLPTGC